MFLILLWLLGQWTPDHQLDINRANRAEIGQLPVDSLTADRIYEYLQLYGRFNSIYDLLKIPGITPEKLDEIKPLIYIRPRTWEERVQENVQRVQRRLAAEDGPSRVVVEEWQDLLLDPVNVNRATVDELLLLENVSLVDAVAVVNFIRQGGKITSRRDLASKVPGLSTFGYRGMRNYVTFQDRPDTVRSRIWSGNYRLKYDSGQDWEVVISPEEFAAALNNLVQDSARFREAGFNEGELAFFRTRLEQERAFRVGMGNTDAVRHRLRMRFGERFRAGGWLEQNLYERAGLSDAKGFVSVDRFGPVRRLLAGDYRLTLGQGLLLDNNFELRARTHRRYTGLFGDLTENPGFGLRGAAVDLQLNRFGLLGFYSHAKRDGILNPDSTVNWYIISTPRYPTFKDLFAQTDAGASWSVDLSQLGFLPLGTRIGVNGLFSRTSRSLQPAARYLELPGDAEMIEDPNWTRLDTGRTRLFYSADLRTVINNLAIEGEFARQHRGGSAYLVKGYLQYDLLNLTVLYRHYDVDYVNPYNRGFCEELRFEDTPLEKPYRLIDPAYSALQNFPMPKAEQGLFAEMRYQISRQITFTRAYIDVWRNLAYGADNFRFQAEMEYRPVFPLRLRFRQKVQLKERPRLVMGTGSRSLESSVRALVSLSNWDYLTAELRYSRTQLTPTLRYDDRASIDGDFVLVQWEHNFSDDFQGELGVASWRSGGASNWMFEDTGIDFVDGDGYKWYLALTNRLTDHLLVYLKFRQKLSLFPHTGLAGNEGVHYPDMTPVQDFVSQIRQFDIRLQVDFLW